MRLRRSENAVLERGDSRTNQTATQTTELRTNRIHKPPLLHPKNTNDTPHNICAIQ